MSSDFHCYILISRKCPRKTPFQHSAPTQVPTALWWRHALRLPTYPKDAFEACSIQYKPILYYCLLSSERSNKSKYECTRVRACVGMYQVSYIHSLHTFSGPSIDLTISSVDERFVSLYLSPTIYMLRGIFQAHFKSPMINFDRNLKTLFYNLVLPIYIFLYIVPPLKPFPFDFIVSIRHDGFINLFTYNYIAEHVPNRNEN